jgi:hypothetical protein
MGTRSKLRLKLLLFACAYWAAAYVVVGLTQHLHPVCAIGERIWCVHETWLITGGGAAVAILGFPIAVWLVRRDLRVAVSQPGSPT